MSSELIYILIAVFISTNLLLFISIILIAGKNKSKQQDNIFSQMKFVTDSINTSLDNLNQKIEIKLEKSEQRNTQTFTDVVKRLALIDNAQNKLQDLSKDVIDLQAIFKDKKSRGAFGEIQLNYLIENILPRENYQTQYKLSNGNIVDGILILPSPNGKICIDSKFPLESFNKINNPETDEQVLKLAKQQFKTDIKKHINDIAQKYIIPHETANHAIMFLPSEAVFAEIHANHPELVNLSYQMHVFITSPTTLMAIITTAGQILKDDMTYKQINVIREHLIALGKDFDRFADRMEKLGKNIDKVHSDKNSIEISAKKISSRFKKIEAAKIDELETCDLPE